MQCVYREENVVPTEEELVRLAEAELIAKERQAAAVAFYNNLYEEVKSSYENGKEELGKLLEQN